MVKKVLKEILKEGVKKARGRGRPKGSTNLAKRLKRYKEAEKQRVLKAKTTKGITKTKKVKAKSGEGTVNRGGAPEPGTVGARKVKTKTTPKATGITKTKPKATGIYKAKPTGIYRAKPKAAVGAATAAGAGATVGALAKAKKVLSSATQKRVGAKRAALAAGVIGGAALLSTKGRSNKAAKVTFGEAFKEARKKGEGTKFTWEGKKFTAVTKDDLKKKGYDDNELRQYANRKGKARGPLNRLGQKAKKVLLGKDKKFGGDKGLIDFIRKPKKKMGGGMANSKPAPKKYKAGGMATKGLGKAYINSKR